MRILVLTDRQWAAPERGRVDDPLLEQVLAWGLAGNEVRVLARRKRGVPRERELGQNVRIRSSGGRLGVLIRAGLRTLRGDGKDADVVLEVVDRIPFYAPLWWWLDAPQVTLVHHVHRERHSLLGWRGRVGAAVTRVSIKLFYGHHAFMAVSARTRDELVEIGVPEQRVDVAILEPPERATALEVLRAAADEERARLLDVLRGSQTGAAAGLAFATLANNAIQLLFTMIFTRILGVSGYGALAALVSAFLILMVTGQSVQAAAAKEATLGDLGDPGHLRLTLHRWSLRLAALTVLLTVISVVFRHELAHLCGVEEHPWAATAILPSGALWMLLSLQRGALQGLRAYAPVGYSLVGEAAGRVVCALILVGIGAGVTGAFLGTPLAFAITSIYLWIVLRNRLGPLPARENVTRRLRTLVADNRIPIFGLLLLALLQNVDVIIARHEFDGVHAGAYAAAAVAAKAVVWVAIGVGLQVLPEATRRAADGDDPRPVLVRALGVLGVVATPALIIFAVCPKLVLRVAFGEDTMIASGALPLLGVAMALLAVAYLSVQYMFALGEWRFVWVLLVIAAAEPPLLLKANFDGLTAYAGIVLGLQTVVALAIVTLGLTTRQRHAKPLTAT